MASFIVLWEVMLRGCGLFHCVLGGCGLFHCVWEVMSRGCGLFHCVWEVMLRGCGLFHCVMGGYVERLWPLSLCFGRLC